jgi:hypothetical protein
MHKNLRHQPPGRATGNGAARKAFATCNLAGNGDLADLLADFSIEISGLSV